MTDSTTEASATAVVDSFTEEKRDEHERAQNAQSLKQQLERAAASHRIHIDVFDIGVPMREPDMDDLITLAQAGERLGDVDEGDGETVDLDGFRDQFGSLFDQVTAILADYNDADEVALDDPTWWDEILTFSETQSVITQLLDAFDDVADAEEIDEFRDE